MYHLKKLKMQQEHELTKIRLANERQLKEIQIENDRILKEREMDYRFRTDLVALSEESSLNAMTSMEDDNNRYPHSQLAIASLDDDDSSNSSLLCDQGQQQKE